MANDRSDDRLLEHDYDGIQEYDNPMPRWWLWLFYASIVFVPVYYFLPGEMGARVGNVASYEADVAAHLASQPVPVIATLSDSTILSFVADRERVDEGKKVFTKNCVACHRADGGGLIGPNLADSSWIHGGAPSAIHTIISEGVLAKGMPAWGRLLKQEEVDDVTAYVITLQGTNPPSPKAPEGPPPAGR